MGAGKALRKTQGVEAYRIKKALIPRGELWRTWIIERIWFHVFARFSRRGELLVHWSIWDHYAKKKLDYYGELSMLFESTTIDILLWQLNNHKRDMRELAAYFASDGEYVLPEQYRHALDRIEAYWELLISQGRIPLDGTIRYKTTRFIRNLEMSEKYLKNRLDHASRFETRGYKRFDNDEIRLGMRILSEEKHESLRETEEGGGEVGQPSHGDISTFIEES